jgi:tetratricopeptide (TPR) repeat protein
LETEVATVRRRLFTVAAAVTGGVALLVHALAAAPLSQEDPIIDAALVSGRVDEEVLAHAKREVAVLARQDVRDALAAALHRLGRVHLARGEYADARTVLQRAIAARPGNPPPSILDDLALSLIRLEAFDDAAVVIDRSRRIRESNGADIAGRAHTFALEAMLLRYQGRYGAARESLARASELVSRLPADDQRTASLRQLFGDIAYLTGDMRAARAAYQEGLDAGRRFYTGDHPELIPLLRKLAAAHSAFGDYAAARGLEEQAARIADAMLAPCHPEWAWATNDLALSNQYYGDYAGARRLFEQMLARARRCAGSSHSLTATAMLNLGSMLRELGDFGAAERMQRDAVAAWTAGLGADHPYVANALDALADVLTDAGRLDEAAAIYQRSLTIRTRKLGENHAGVAWASRGH